MDTLDEAREPQAGRAGFLESGLNRRDLLRSGAVGATLLSSGGLLAGCGSSGSKDKQKQVKGGAEPRHGGKLTVAMTSAGESDTLSPWAAISLPGYAGVYNLYDPLFEFDETGGLRPSLAESIESNREGTVWTARIRKGVTWHDGKPLTADDVVYTVKNWVKPANHFSASLAPLIDGKGVRKRDAHTVEIPLKRAIADFGYVTVNPLCRVVQDGATDKDFNTKPVGTGAFTLVSFAPGVQTYMKANPDYWREGRPYVDELVFDTSFTDETARMNALQAGLADAAPSLSFGAARGNGSSGSFRVSSALSPNSYYFAMNVSKAPFNDVRVQTALKLLADRPQLVESVMAGYGKPGNDLCGPGLKYFASDLKRERDVEQARSLLKQAGQQDLRITLNTTPDAEGEVDSATLFAQQAAEGGVTVNVNRIDPAAYYTPAAGYLSRAFGFEFTATSFGLPMTYLQALWSGAAYDENHLNDRQYDALFLDALGETDEAKAEDKWHAVQQIQFDRGGNLVFAQEANVDGYRNEVGGIDATFAGPSNGYLYRDAFLTQ